MTKFTLFRAVGVTALVLCGFVATQAGEPDRTPPCYSIRAAKFRGCYICSVTPNPSTINWKGKEIVIKEAWLERQQERGFNSGPLLSRLGNTSGYHLCINLSKGWDALDGMQHGWFALDGKGEGFGAMGTCVLWENLEVVDSAEYTILLTDNWKFENAVKIKLTLNRPAKH